MTALPPIEPERKDSHIYGRQPVGANPPEAPIERDGPFVRNATGASRGVRSPEHQFIRHKRDADITANPARRFPGT